MTTAIETSFEEQLDALELMQARLDRLEEKVRRHESTIQALIRWTPEEQPISEASIDTKLLNAGSMTPAVLVWPTERKPLPERDVSRNNASFSNRMHSPENDDIKLALIQTLIDRNHSAIVGLDAQGRVILWNPKAEQMFGWTVDQTLETIPPFFTEKQLEQFGWLVRPDAAVIPFEHVFGEFVNYDGETVEGYVDAQPSDFGGVLLTITPISDVDDAIETNRPESSSLAIEGVISGVAHDLDHVLAVLMTEISQLGEVAGMPEGACDKLDEIHAHHHMAAQLTQQLAKLMHRIDSADHRTHLSNHLSQLRTLILSMCGDAIRLDLTLEEGIIHPAITPGEFDQLVLNLCLNACNAMPHGGTLTIQLCELEQSNRPLCLLMVHDTGGGLSTEQRDVLLHSFQKPGATQRGYGLSIVHAIAKRAGGSVELDSTPGQGTQVRVYLPY